MATCNSRSVPSACQRMGQFLAIWFHKQRPALDRHQQGITANVQNGRSGAMLNIFGRNLAALRWAATQSRRPFRPEQPIVRIAFEIVPARLPSRGRRFPPAQWFGPNWCPRSLCKCALTNAIVSSSHEFPVAAKLSLDGFARRPAQRRQPRRIRCQMREREPHVKHFSGSAPATWIARLTSPGRNASKRMICCQAGVSPAARIKGGPQAIE